MKTERNSNHELLRILAMYMIVFIHANMYLPYFCEGYTRTFFNGFVNGICNIGVTCFILISGYYEVKFDVKKFVKMECMMITYSLLETAVLYVMTPEQMQGAQLLEQLVKSVLPFITRKYWFYSCYVCLLLLSSYIHKLIAVLSRKDFEKLLLLLLTLFSVLPTLCYFELMPDNGKGLVQMIMIYMIGRYIRMYRDDSIRNLMGIKRAIFLFGALWILNGISHEFPIQIGGIYHHLCKDNSITNLLMAIILFYLFKELNFQSRMINKAASYVFAVFALNNSFVTVIMTNLPINTRKDIVGFGVLAGIVLIILIVCLVIGAVREVIFAPLDKKAEKTAEKIWKRIQNL